MHNMLSGQVSNDRGDNWGRVLKQVKWCLKLNALYFIYKMMNKADCSIFINKKNHLVVKRCLNLINICCMFCWHGQSIKMTDEMTTTILFIIYKEITEGNGYAVCTHLDKRFVMEPSTCFYFR